jgi:hypothetical protein
VQQIILKEVRLKILIYIPTFGRPQVLMYLLDQIIKQKKDYFSGAVRPLLTPLDFVIMVSVNGDSSYDLDAIKKYTDRVTYQDFNLGADINISLAFTNALKINADYLMILGDDEPISENLLSNISKVLQVDLTPDLILGSKNFIGDKTISKKLWSDLNSEMGGTLSFISSTIYKVIFDEKDAESSILYAFTGYSHLVVQHRLLNRHSNLRICAIPVQELIDYDYKISVDPLIPRNSLGFRESFVFFGKVLSVLGSENDKYINAELKKWWLKNWHRASMYRHKKEFRGELLYRLNPNSFLVKIFIIASKMPYWKIKDLIKPVKNSRKPLYIYPPSSEAGKKYDET